MYELLTFWVQRGRRRWSLRVLLLGSIFNGLARERLVLLALGVMLELLECLGDVPWHQQVYLTPFVIPVEGDPGVPLAVSFGLDFVVLLDRVLKMHCVLLADVLYAKVVHDQCELHWSPVVLLQTGDELALMVAMLVKPLLEEFIC